MSDERDSAGAPGDGSDSDNGSPAPAGGRTAVANRPLRPTGKRSRQAVAGTDGGSAAEPETDGDSGVTKNGSGKKAKTARKSGPSRNPLLFVVTYIKQVVAELRKVIWPNRKQMVSYTTVVLVFLAFMVALVFGVDWGFAKLVQLVFGD
ncbi:preprotein translocase subunit SecE [Mycobacterium sp. MYCO198283]|uniref:preprotein translocase subunit SecE n=1 Tax=Mycobacterium sp. MYCO198283 TaxID=2883505 RepID=UPI001E423661|nr:preprotein translocase subunit SecE [Mycobacterium sp. MYCO198283]MCG5431928.1 preprotein translocase subunit SecE [Mycobacterium sp. MYCO198283]